MAKLHELKRQKSALAARMKAIVAKEDDLKDGEELPDADKTEFQDLKDQVAALDERIGRTEDAMAAQGEAIAEAVEGAGGGEGEGDDAEKAGRIGVRKGVPGRTVPAEAAPSKVKGLIVAGAAKMMVLGGGNVYAARQAARDVYGENHPVTKALLAGSGPAGGFLVPPEQALEIIELLRAKTVIRANGPRTLNMPRGTMNLPRQNQSATASYGGETSPIMPSQPGVGQVVATYKKLTALVPVSNDLLRYADPSADTMVRDDIVKVMARREDLAFVRGDGTEGSPKGLLSFVLPGNVGISTAAFTLMTVAAELGWAINQLETGNVEIDHPLWLMNPRSKNFMFNVQNVQGLYVYREEMTRGTLLGIPFATTTQIPTNLTVGGNNDCSEVYLTEMTENLVLDSMALELGVSQQASYLDGNGQLVHTFQQDQSLIRAISEHDFQVRHNESVVILKGVRWRPAAAFA